MKGTGYEVSRIGASVVPPVDQLGRDDWNAQYRATFTNLWNAATVAFYWNEMEPEEGKIRYAVSLTDFQNSAESRGPVYTSDMRREKAYYVLDDLINRAWKTRLSVRADDTGGVAFLGFKGRYRLTAKGASG